MLICELCKEEILPDENKADVKTMDAHRECCLRMALGGIGHFTNHQLWCVERSDPDMGLTLRQSALAVDQWVADYGISKAVSVSLSGFDTQEV